MTEEEAKTKWCAMIRYERDLVNRSDNLSQGPYCIGSQCMMWRKVSAAKFGMDKDGTPCAAISDTVDGYCGLAGKP